MSARATRSQTRNAQSEESEQTSSSAATSSEYTTSTETGTASMDQGKSQAGSEGTVVNREASVGSRHSTASIRRRAELEAKLEFQKKEKERLEAEAALARTKMELVQLDDASDPSEVEDNEDDVAEWVHKTTQPEYRKTKKKNTDVSDLASAIVNAINSTKTPKAPPKYINELHYFDGDPREWISFKATYTDTATYFSDIENVARLRRAIKGQARDSVKSLMYTSRYPDEIMKALERRFGRPTFLIKSEIAALERIPAMGSDIKGIGSFASAVSNSVNTIKLMNKIEYLYSYEISEKIIEKMNIIVRFRWHEYRSKHENEPILLSLSKFLNTIADQFETYEGDIKPRVKKEFLKGRQPPRPRRVNAARYHSDSEDTDGNDSDFESDSEYEEEKKIVFAAMSLRCPLCKKEHELQKCKEFEAQSIKERWETVKTIKVCFKCLRSSHRSINCKAKPCAKEGCTRRHHALLHSDPVPPGEPAKKETDTQIVSVNHVGATRAFLKILPVELSGPNGSITVGALLDEGSTVTLLLDEIAEKIGANGPTTGITIEGVTGHLLKEERSKKVNLRIRGALERNFENIAAHTIQELNLSPQRVRREDIADCPHLTEVSDRLVYEHLQPSLLIGQDNWHLIVTRELKSGSPNKPVAFLTKLGWILHGYKTDAVKHVMFSSHITCKPIDSIEALIKNHFDLDAIGITQRKPKSDPEERALSILKNTTKRLPEGRFECGLLWKTDNETMPPNRESAMKRLLSIEKKMRKDEIFKTKYSEQVHNLLRNGYAERALAPPTSTRTWYLPHFAVVHPQKGKMRLVFDAAERTEGKSLNDALLSGPDLLQSLFGVLIRFRQGPIAVAADIKEMFLRIQIIERDRDSLRFLWRETEDQQPQEYRMKSLIFGAASSPCSAIYAKNANANDFAEKYPEAVFAIQRCHYMDDFLQSFATKEEAKTTSQQVDTIHRAGGFELRGWASNDPYVTDSFQDKQAGHVNLSSDEQIEKTLGMLWNVTNDSLNYSLNLRNTPEDVIRKIRPPTKREVTSAIMSVFDPLGLATPISIQGKKLIQLIWKTGIEWDQTIPEELHEKWDEWIDSLRSLQALNVPRCTNSLTDGELHTFVDASESTYAAAVYWKTYENFQPSVKLLAAKAKVAPLKPTSIPRLELQAALLGCRLASNIAQEIQTNITKKVYWSDSRTTLAWIKSDPRTFKAFVAHRLAEIEDLTKTSEWRWVPSSMNVADVATKTVPRDFNTTHRWFSGPEFLLHSEEKWPLDTSDRKKSPDTGEEKKTVASVTKPLRRVAPLIPDPLRFSSWTRLLRSTARFLQSVEIFKSKLRKPTQVAAIKKTVRDVTWRKYNRKKRNALPDHDPPPTITYRTLPPLTDRNLSDAETLLIKHVQTECFKEEKTCLRECKNIPKTSRLRKLKMTLINEVIHLDTRVSAATYLSDTYKNPIVLDGNHHATKLLVMKYHTDCNHGNHQTVMNELRQRYYIVSLRNTVKNVARTCQWCRLHKNTPLTPPTGDLPAERLQYRQPPFTCTGVDYFGPINITVGRRQEKRWVALYTCLTTRAIHLEIATSLSADSMILTLRRMIARRGTPKVLYSDNGTNFIGADKELKQAAEERAIQWKRIPAGAPHMGGAWERLVRTVKVALEATLRSRQPREEILHTLLLEAEHLINSRPLTEVSLNPDDPESLTPNHFLIGRSNGAMTPGEFNDRDLVGPATWRTAQRLTDMFWKRWLSEYLPTITPKKLRGTEEFDDLTLGDIVIIADSSLPRGVWPRGEVVMTYPGPDKRTRIVDIRTTAGTMRRPATRVIRIGHRHTN